MTHCDRLGNHRAAHAVAKQRYPCRDVPLAHFADRCRQVFHRRAIEVEVIRRASPGSLLLVIHHEVAAAPVQEPRVEAFLEQRLRETDFRHRKRPVAGAGAVEQQHRFARRTAAVVVRALDELLKAQAEVGARSSLGGLSPFVQNQYCSDMDLRDQFE